jgi:DNA-binding transcriptional MerR regulator
MPPDQDPPDTLTLQELADHTGIEPRTLRSYVEKGLLPGPDSLGRGARYPREALDRLRVMQLLRDAKPDLSLDQIRLLLQSLTPFQLREVAAGHQRIAGIVDTDAPRNEPDGALAYLRTLRSKQPQAFGRTPVFGNQPPAPVQPAPQAAAQPGAPTHPAAPNPPPRGEAPSAADLDQLGILAQAARALAELTQLAPAARSTRGSPWYRIQITPFLELHARGEHDPEQLAHLHRIGDALRILLTKGSPR